jgi:hypothetical protein
MSVVRVNLIQREIIARTDVNTPVFNHFLFESMNHLRWECETFAAVNIDIEPLKET